MKLFIFVVFFFLHVSYAKQIASIPEASGICFNEITNTLFVVGDEGYIYELTTDGKILREKHLGNYDLEGVACDTQKQQLLLANEADNSIVILSRESFEIINTIAIKKKYKKIKILHKKSFFKFLANNGLEAITLVDDRIFLSNQSNNFWPKKHPSVIFAIKEKKKKKKAKIAQIYDYMYKDISALTFHQGYLYMISDKADLLVKIDLTKDEVVKEYTIPGSDQEGVCFDNKNNIYFADDNGYVLKFTKKELGI